MSARIAHRGPDDSDALVLGEDEARVGLAHRRLSIIDLSPLGRQPMAPNCAACGCTAADPPERRLWIVYNGELYNYPALRKELEGRGHRFTSHSDTEVLLHLYADEGPAMLGRLNGIFAFAIYDGRTRGLKEGMQPGDLVIARDGLGVKPLYYAETRSGLLFASELKALHFHPEVDRTIDPVAIQSYLTYLWCPCPRTPFQGVRKLAPGEWMLVRGGRIVRREYHYNLPYGQPAAEEDEAALVSGLRDELAAAVDRQMIADVPVGAFLSGGVDSSTVVAMMRGQRPGERIRCYCIGFRDEGRGAGHDADNSDLQHARAVAKHLNVDLCEILVEPSMINQLERMLYHLDEPQADPAPINAMFIAARAREDGIKVLMSGAGGDDLFSGYRRHVALGLERYWAWMPAPMRRLLAAPASRSLSGEGPPLLQGTVAGRRMVKMFAYAGEPEARRLVSYFHWNSDKVRRSLFSPALREQLASSDASEPLLESLSRIPGERDPLNRMLYLEGKHFLADHNLNYVDKMSMSEGVEVRVPLLDQELVQYAARLPSRIKQRGQVGKYVLKKAVEPLLPHEVIYRRKAGFGAPLRHWLKNDLRPVMEDILSPAALKRRGLFDPDQVERVRKLDTEGRIDASYTLFSLMCIELWCRLFLDSTEPHRNGWKPHD